MESDVTQSATFIKLWTWFNEHARQLVIGTGAVLLVAIIVGFVSWRSNAKQLAANEALSVALNRGFAASPEAAPAVVKIADTFPQTDAAGRALLLGGSKFFLEGDYAQAEMQFRRFMREFPSSPWTPQAALGAAASLDSLGKVSEAIAAYKEVLERHAGSPASLQAKIALARLYEGQGNLTQARDIYDELMRTVGGSVAQEAALLLEQLFTRHPELAPSHQAATNPGAETPSLPAAAGNATTSGTNVPVLKK